MNSTRKQQTARLPETPVLYNGRNLDWRKERTKTFVVVVWDAELGEIVTPIVVRVWMSRRSDASVNHASIWIRGRRTAEKTMISLSGRGQAGGHGYCRMSAAVDEAISSAGVTLGYDIHGVGEEAVTEALLAIANAVGYGDCVKQVLTP